MSISTFNKPPVASPRTSDRHVECEPATDFDHNARASEGRDTVTPGSRHFLRFIAELRRRQVCRAATMYAVALWVICQVVELFYVEVGLPEWTLRFVIVVGLIGFPIAVSLSWLFDVTPEGVVRDGGPRALPIAAGEDKRRSPADRIIDCGLLLTALVIGSQLAMNVAASGTGAQYVPGDRIAVMPFPVTSAQDSGEFSAGLRIALQHELALQTTLKVVVPRDPSKVRSGSSLTGSVVFRDDHVRVTALIIDNRTGEITWSKLFQIGSQASAPSPTEIARGIVAALELPGHIGAASVETSVAWSKTDADDRQ